MTVSNCEVSVQSFSNINISIPDLTRIHIILRKIVSMFCVVNKQSTLHLKKFSDYRWHKKISSFRYLIEYWKTVDCNKFNRVLFILKRNPYWMTISKCQVRKRDGSSGNEEKFFQCRCCLNIRLVFKILYDHVKCFFPVSYIKNLWATAECEMKPALA